MSEDNRTQLVLLADRSGSMSGSAHELTEAIGNFIEDQAAVEGKAWITLADFDRDHATVEGGVVRFVLRDQRLTGDTALGWQIDPRGSTPLWEALSITIDATKHDLATAKNPRKVIFVVITDGLENASHGVTAEDVRTKIKACEEEGWQFVYLGAAVDAFGREAQMAQSGASGMPVNNSVAFAAAPEGYRSAVANTSSAVTRSRLGGDIAYTDEEREAIANADSSSK